MRVLNLALNPVPVRSLIACANQTCIMQAHSVHFPLITDRTYITINLNKKNETKQNIFNRFVNETIHASMFACRACIGSIGAPRSVDVDFAIEWKYRSQTNQDENKPVSCSISFGCVHVNKSEHFGSSTRLGDSFKSICTNQI